MVHLECMRRHNNSKSNIFLFLCIEINYLHSSEIAFDISKTGWFVTILFLGDIMQ